MKNKTLNPCYFLGFLAFFMPFLSISQEKPNSDWMLQEEKGGVKIYKKLVDCNLPNEGLYAEYYLLKIENTTQTPMEVSWKNEKYYNHKCITCNNPEDAARSRTVLGNKTIEGECSMYGDKHLKVFVKWTQLENKRVLTKSEITNLSVTPIN